VPEKGVDCVLVVVVVVVVVVGFPVDEESDNADEDLPQREGAVRVDLEIDTPVSTLQ
jgi:hypothetical protein